MIERYNFSDLPERYYGKKYSIFSFEVFDDIPYVLYIGDAAGHITAITGLQEIYKYRSRLAYSGSMSLSFRRPNGDSYPILVSRDRVESIIKFYENEINAIRKKNTAMLFEMFLKSITIDRTNKNVLPNGFEFDRYFVASNYGIRLNVEGDETSTITMTCDNSEINKSVAKTIDILKDINNAEDEKGE